MAKFRKKPVVIDAVQFDGTPYGANEVFDAFDVPGVGEVMSPPAHPSCRCAVGISSVSAGSELWKCADWNFSTQSCYGSWVKLKDLIPGEEYSIVVYIDPLTPGGQYYYWARSNVNAYGPGEAWYNIGGWVIQNTFDMTFRIFSTQYTYNPPTAAKLLGGNSSYGILNTIEWCPDYVSNDYCLLGGSLFGGAVSNIFKYRGTGFDPEPFTKTDDDFNDISWFPNGAEAVIVGDIGGSGSVYTHYAGEDIILDVSGKLPVGTGPLFGVACKGPSSPSSAILVGSSGGIGFFPSAMDQNTKITANSVFPKLYWIGINNTAGTSRMDMSVPVDSWYNFTLEANYSQPWNTAEIIVSAWYDRGLAGVNSFAPPPTDETRNLAFNLTYNVALGTYSIDSPVAPADLEIMIDAGGVPVDNLLVGTGSPGEEHHRVELPIYFGKQIRFAGGSFTGGPVFFDADKNNALLDINSWDFNVSVRDAGNPTAYNASYGEFGVDETVSVLVSGNPTGSAPPGTTDNPLANPTQISYSANTEHWVNISIPHLYENGNLAALDWIPCDDVSVQNVCLNATVANSDISVQTYMPVAENQDVYVWGQDFTPISAPNNGTNATGPAITNYIGPIWGELDSTQLDWWVSVQAGTKEGVYWAVITITIES